MPITRLPRPVSSGRAPVFRADPPGAGDGGGSRWTRTDATQIATIGQYKQHLMTAYAPWPSKALFTHFQ